MTKEQQESIETLEGMVKSYIEADECGLSNNDFKHEIRAMQTVLNMLKEKDKEINRQNGIINALQCELKERTEERDRKDDIVTKQNKTIDFYKKGLEREIKSNRDNIVEIIKKDKIIDKISQNPFNELRVDGIRFCGKDIKQYFERKCEE